MRQLLAALLLVCLLATPARPQATVISSATDIAWTGSSTTVLSFTPTASGIYEVTITVSATTTDTVTCTVGYTDAVNTTAQTLTVISAVVTGANGVADAVKAVRANTSTAIVVKISSALHTTTKASVAITRKS